MSKQKAKELTVAKRRQEVIQLRESGATWRAIAETMQNRHGDALPKNYGHREACRDLHRELDRVRRENEESLQSIRDMELRRLDRMLRGLWQRAINGDDKAIQSSLRIMDRRSKLLGLDAVETTQTQNLDLDLSSLSDEQLDRIIAGENPLEVVRDADDEGAGAEGETTPEEA